MQSTHSELAWPATKISIGWSVIMERDKRINMKPNNLSTTLQIETRSLKRAREAALLEPIRAVESKKLPNIGNNDSSLTFNNNREYITRARELSVRNGIKKE